MEGEFNNELKQDNLTTDIKEKTNTEHKKSNSPEGVLFGLQMVISVLPFIISCADDGSSVISATIRFCMCWIIFVIGMFVFKN